MQPDEIDHALSAAQNYLDKQMAPADLVAVVSLANSLSVNQDFTQDKAQLKKALQAFGTGSGQGFEEGSTGTTEGTADTGGSFTADDTEYNIFNTDRRLERCAPSLRSLLMWSKKSHDLFFQRNGSHRG